MLSTPPHLASWFPQQMADLSGTCRRSSMWTRLRIRYGTVMGLSRLGTGPSARTQRTMEVCRSTASTSTSNPPGLCWLTGQFMGIHGGGCDKQHAAGLQARQATVYHLALNLCGHCTSKIMTERMGLSEAGAEVRSLAGRQLLDLVRVTSRALRSFAHNGREYMKHSIQGVLQFNLFAIVCLWLCHKVPH